MGNHPRQASEARTEAHRAGNGHTVLCALVAYVAIGVSVACALAVALLCLAVIASMVYVAAVAFGL
jgi:hypothetical protein